MSVQASNEVVENECSDTTMGQADQCEKVIGEEQETQTTEASAASKVGVASTVEPFCDLRVASKARHNIRDKGDKEVCWITGCQYLPDGSLVVCDFNNSKLKLLNQKHELQSSLRLPSDPEDLAVISQDEVVVASPDSNTVQFVSVKGDMKCGRTIDLDCGVCAVAVHKHHLYALCRNRNRSNDLNTGSYVQVLDMQGRRVRTLGVTSDGSFLFRFPDCITVDAKGRVYVSDSIAHTVTCFSAAGDIVYTYNNREQEQAGLLVDSRQNLYVCDSRSDNIHVLSRDGRKLKSLLSSTAGLKVPRSISYRSSDRTLVVGMWDNEIMSYKLK